MRHGHRGRGFGRPGGWQQADLPETGDITDWFAGRLPAEWFTGPPVIEIDRDEIVVIGELPLPQPEEAAGEDSGRSIPEATKEGAVARFRESTRSARMQIADEAQQRYRRSVAWGVSIDGQRTLFTHLAVPVMTRLRQ